ncbi:RtcB family protein [Desulfogranum japonicum]|uniref:RtcB family protein n=1 Tax=Desulfogranum japonicum TaxID=231447 RepID=UPI0003FAB7EF|nr:RtcB family protein [Desulfogranum japonicum]
MAESTPESFGVVPKISHIALTPDFHKGKGIPVGTVLATQGFIVPQAIGNDINCGMRLHATSLSADQIKANLDKLETVFRRIFFEGGRNIPMSRAQREALFKNGITGLLDATPKSLMDGLWSLFHNLNIENDLNSISQKGSLKAKSTFGLNDFLGPADRLSRDSQIGSIGGGNHFVEIQYVKSIINGSIAHAWGLKPGMVTVMVHTGSVAVGHLSGNFYNDLVRKIYPQSLKYPSNNIFPLPVGLKYQKEVEQFWDALANAANFAFANRLFLAIMALDALQNNFGQVEFSLIYDSPHNLVWRETINGESCFIHRKGACPANGLNEMVNTPFEYYGEPVMVPGSMGASSYLLAGQGNQESIRSASHGAGRVLSRGKALKGYEAEFKRFLKNFRVVTPVDLRRPDIKLRKDIVLQKFADIKQEAPFAYKGITPIVETLSGAGIATPVVELEPLMTIKG